MIHTNGTVYRYGTQVHYIYMYSAAAIYSVTVVLNLVGYSTTSRQTALVTKFSTRVLVQAVPASSMSLILILVRNVVVTERSS